MANLHCEAIAFPSSDGKHTSSAFLYTVPGQPVRAVLQLSHGMCEYVRRYAPMAESTLPTALRWRATTTSATVTPPRQGSTATTVSRMAVATS